MSKRKQSNNEGSDSDSSDISLIDVDFDFCDPNPDVDYHAIKRLLSQLFQRDAETFHLHELTELILSQPKVGSTIKTDGTESDPYAVLTVLNMHLHHQHPSMKAIANYCLEKASSDLAFHSTLNALFSQNQHHVGLVVCERLINMPVQVIPPMYRMLGDEVKRAVEEASLSVLSSNEPYTFSHLLFISRTYHLTPDEESALYNSASARNGKNKTKKTKRTQPSTAEVAPPTDGIFSFHPEDEVIKQATVHTLDYTFTTAAPEPRDRESFGLDTRGRMMLVPAERFEELVQKMLEVYSVS
ncbi:p21-C-terminal region-binding protein-domain-containing protein [Cyathus striatus]|nr:p21-C-terminal region-binding protein-domain-containing protein [Cyathus striatus]